MELFTCLTTNQLIVAIFPQTWILVFICHLEKFYPTHSVFFKTAYRVLELRYIYLVFVLETYM